MREYIQKMRGHNTLSEQPNNGMEAKPVSVVDDMMQHLSNKPINQQDRSYHPEFVRKRKIRVKIRILDGTCCIGDCHVVWPDGRTSDVINDDRKFLILTDATVEGEHHIYNILTINKERIEMIFELHRPEQEIS